jgi:ABC-type uncharacterized transport system substrate-binding protein
MHEQSSVLEVEMTPHTNALSSGRLSNGRSTKVFRRRAFLVGMCAMVVGPRTVMAQEIRRIGILGDTPGPQWDVFRRALVDLGYVEGRNVAFVSQYSLGNSARFTELAAELVSSGVEIIVVEGGVATNAAKTATSSIPIVMTIVGDPVGSGLVASLGTQAATSLVPLLLRSTSLQNNCSFSRSSYRH